MNVGELNVELTMNANDFTVTVKRAGEIVEQFTKQLTRTADSVQKLEAVHTSMGRTFRNFMITIASVRFALMDFNDVVLGMPRNIVKVSGELERMTRLMQGLSTASTEAGRQMEAQKSFEYVINLAQRAPFEIKSITDAFVKLKAGGLDPMDGSLQALIDGVAKFGGNSETLHRAAVAIQQMAGKGVISMEELRQQLGEAMPNAMQAMARGMGVSIAEMVKAVSSGTVEAKTALKQMFLVMSVENQGAAAAMMSTWSGLSSQLVTQLHLLEKEAGDAGFFKEVKAGAQELLDLMKSSEGKQFARDIGSGLAEATRVTKDLVKTIAEYKDEIVTIGEVIISVWAGTKILGAINATRAQISSLAAEQRAISAQITQAKIEAIQRENAQAVAAQEAELARNAEKLAAAKTLQAQLLAQHARYLAEVEALDARYRLTANGRFQDTTTGRFARTAEVQAQLDAARQRLQMNEALRQANRASREELDRLNAAARSNITLLGQQAAVVAQGAAKFGIMALAIRGLGAAINFLGGPLGATITVLSFMIPLWSRWANAGEEAIKKVREALANGNGTRKDAATIDKLIFEKQNEIAEAEKILEEQVNAQRERGLSEKLIDETFRGKRAAIARLKGELAQLQSELNVAVKQALTGDERRGAEDATKAVNETLEQITADTKKKLADSVKEREEALKEKGANVQKITEEAAKRETDIIKKGEQAQLNALIAASRNVDEQIAKGGLSPQRLKELKGAQKALNDLIAEHRKSFADIDLVGSGIHRGQSNKVEREKNPLVVALEQAKADYQNAKDKLDELDEGAVTLDGMTERILEKLKAQARLGQFNYKDQNGKIINASENDPMLQEIARQRAATIAADQVSQALQRTLSSEASLKEELALANDRLALGSDKFVGAYARAVSEIAKGNAKLAQGADGWEKLTEAQRRQLALAANVDLTNVVAAQLSAARNVQAQLLTTVEDRLKAEIDAVYNAETAKFQIVAEQLLNTEGANFETLAKLQVMWGQFAQALGTRLAVIAKQNQSPMEKLLEQWADTTQRMKELQASWADDLINEMAHAAVVGRGEWSKLLQGMLEDILKLQLRKNLGGALASLMQTAFSSFFGSPSTPDSTGAAAAITNGGLSSHAMGGIVDALGPRQLKRYANGGIANSPHVALFGEGSTPEAYVPLPDGRTIPVTVKGGLSQSPTVIVNVINQTNQEVTAEQKTPRIDAGQMILDVVLSGVNKPGSFRDGMRSAIR